MKHNTQPYQLHYTLMKNYNSAEQTLTSVLIESIKLQEAFSFVSNLTFSPSPISSFPNAEFFH